jgi:thermostable 8-oxoguanine DNA glycosylase
MIPEFEKLRDDEVEILLKAPAYVSVLIAGADDNIDKSEIQKAIQLAKVKQQKARESLLDYYKAVGERFESDFMTMIEELPHKAADRGPAINRELKKLNLILPKLNKTFSTELYASLKDIAKKIAESSGGILGYLSVSYEEAKLMELTMINDPAKK